ncbi:MAG: TIGR03936 family radical SAM-associated protein [Defluviitaleaceae bacterium]|nr:TIGR03936 family radical SAM-associated protein [Defluviitaleaceae bacterium]
MSLKQSYFRYRISFTKLGSTRFIGHLDLQSLFQRAIKRAKLPVAYSEGFNPHQLLSFAAPLPLGMGGFEEMLEIFLIYEVNVKEIVTLLQDQLPDGIDIVGVVEVPAIGRSAAAIIQKATYRITFSHNFDIRLEKIISDILTSESIKVEKKGKKGMSVVDIRPDIFEIVVDEDNSLRAILACGSERNLKANILAHHILGLSEIAQNDCDITYERLSIGQDVPKL